MDNLIDAFNKIRDIPYRIPLTLEEESCNCSGKSIKLREFFDHKWYISRYRICTFKWSDMNLPEAITKIPHQDDSTHVYIELFMNNKWINIDPTWDDSLSPTFKISIWDWMNSTMIAVNPRELFDDTSSKSIMENQDNNEVLKDLEINWEFYKTFNSYLEEVRRSK